MRGRPAIVAALAIAAVGCGRDQPAEQRRGGNQAAPASAAAQQGVTPMGERVAVIGLLNKRNGIVRDLTMRPGQSVRFKDAIVRVRACETSAPWENERLTGAFVQLDVQGTDGKYRRAFSGWLYKESPSLNVVEHPVYDVWPKSCAMTFPAGPDAPAAPSASSNRSSASRSPSAAAPPRERPAEPAPTPAPEPAAPPPSASPSNST